MPFWAVYEMESAVQGPFLIEFDTTNVYEMGQIALSLTWQILLLV